jgi:putative ABC transport system permease protein
MSIADLPRMARALLRVALPEDWRDDILRDLEEAWTRKRIERGALVAILWLWGQAIAFSIRFAPGRAAELISQPLPTSTDLKLALRSTVRAPFVTALAVVALGIGIGSAVAGYTIIEGVVFTSFDFEGGDRIMMVQDYDVGDQFAIDIGAAEYVRRRDAVQSFEFLAAYLPRTMVLGDGETRSVVRTYFVTLELLRMTGVEPIMGRLPDQTDVQPGAEPVVLLPHAVWIRVTGSDPAAVGRRIELGGVRRTVIGVMPEGFGFPWDATIWIPFDARDADGPLKMIAKLREGTDLRTARAELNAVARPDPTQVSPGADIVHLVTPLNRPMTADRQIWVVAIPIVILVMLLVVMATNVANLVLARNATRTSELAVRTALGASRPRVVGQLAAEVVLMVAGAAVFGVWLSRRGVSILEANVDLPAWTDLSLDAGAVLFGVALAGLVTFVAGVVPALRVTGDTPGDALRDGGRGKSNVRFGRLTSALIIVQVTICVGFLSVAALLGQSLMSYSYQRYGLPAEETLVAQLYFGWPSELNDPDAGLTETQRAERRGAFLAEATRKREEIRASVLQLPDVRFAAYGSRFPGNESERASLEVEDLDDPAMQVEIAEVGAGYFDLIGSVVVAGRDFTAEEHAGALPVVLVNEPFVRDLLGGANPLGRRVRVTPEDAAEPDPWATVVGVVPDLGLNPGNPANAAAVYRPLPPLNVVRLAVRGDAPPGTWTARLVDITRDVDENIRVQWTTTLAAQMREPVAIFRTLGFGFLVMGALALLLSAASIHALTACTVTRRTREIGIRQALGAGASRIVGDVLRRSVTQLALGTILGTALGLGLLQLSRVFPWEVRQANPTALGIVVAGLTLSGVVALAQPLRRALSIRPADAMRAE